MPFIIGTPIPEDKVLVHAVSCVYGIGFFQSSILCKKVGFGLDARGSDLALSRGKALEALTDTSSVLVGSDLRRFKTDKIRRLCAISAYRGLRHKRGLPVRGQRTHTNSKRRVPFC